MHVGILTYGDVDGIQRLINDLRAQILDYEFGHGVRAKTKLQVRQWIPLDLVFPEPEYMNVLGMLQPVDPTPKFRNYMIFLRKLLGYKTIPKFPEKNNRVFRPDVRVVPIGFKKDTYTTREIL